VDNENIISGISTLQTYRLLIFYNPGLPWLREITFLYSQHNTARGDIFRQPISSASQHGHSYRSRQDPPLALASFFKSHQVQSTRMPLRSQSRVFNNSYFRVVFISDLPPGLQKSHLLVGHTLVYQIIFNTEQPIGTSSLSSYPGQASC